MTILFHLLVLLALLLPARGWAAVAFDAKMTGGNAADGMNQEGDNVTSVTSAAGLTIGASATCLVGTLVLQAASTAVSGVTMTWNGGAMTAGPVAVFGTNSAHLFYLSSPITGTRALTASWTNTADAYLSGVSFSGADSAACVNAAHNVTATNTTTITVTSSTDGATIAVFSVNGSTPTMNFTPIWDDAPLAPGGGASYQLGGTSNAHTFTGAGGSTQALVGIHIQASADAIPPTDPTNLIGTVTGSETTALTWTASTDASGIMDYRVERCTGASCVSWAEVGTPVTNSFADSGRVASTLYRYRVRAFDGANFSGYSNIADVLTLAVRQATLTWTDTNSTPNNEELYRVQRKTGTGTYADLATTAANATGYVDTTSPTSTLGSSACYVVRAEATGFTASAYSAEVCTGAVSLAAASGSRAVGVRLTGATMK